MRTVTVVARKVIQKLDRAIINLQKRNTRSVFDFDSLETVNIFPAAGEIVHKSKLATPQQVEYPLTKREAYVLHEVLVWPHQGIAASMDGDILKETSESPYRLQHIMNRIRFSARSPMRIDTPCVSIEADPFWSNYYHLFIDNIPRLYSLHHEKFLNEEKILLLLTREPSELEHFLFKTLLPANVELMQLPAGITTVACRKYLFLPFVSGGHWAASLPREYLAWFRERIFAALGTEPISVRDEKIYISREKAPKRRFTNEQELASRLQGAGFRKYHLEDMSFAEQVSLFRRAKTVVAPHGAGLTNLLFATDCHVLENISGELVQEYRMLSAALNLPYANVVNENAKVHEDIPAPVEELLSKITQMSNFAGPYSEVMYGRVMNEPANGS